MFTVDYNFISKGGIMIHLIGIGNDKGNITLNAFKAIKDSDILAYPIALPPLGLQNRFAAFVQQIDKAKSIAKQQIADLQELLDSKMQEYFA